MKSLFYLNKYLWKYKWILLLGFFFIILNNYLKVYGTLIVGDAVNFIKESLSTPDLTGDTQTLSDIKSEAIKLGGLFVLIAVISGFFLFLQRQTIIVVSRKIEYLLKKDVYDHYQVLDRQFFKENNTGDIMNRISEDVSRVRMYLGPALMYTTNLIVLSAIILPFMIQKSASMTLYTLIPLPIMSILIYLISSKMNKKNHEMQEQQSHLSTLSQENFSGIRVLKSYHREGFVFNNFYKETQKYRSKVMNLVLIESWFMPTVFLLIGLSTFITVYVGVQYYEQGLIKIGDVAEFVIYVNMLTWPFASLGWVTSLVQRASSSMSRINQFLNVNPKIVSEGDLTFQPGDIKFEKVSLTYPETGITALNNISFELKAGQSLGVIGKTGSGKSSLAQLLMRLYDPTEGSITINNQAINKFNLHDFRNVISWVPQEVFLFSDTIKNNISFGAYDVNVSQEDIEKVSKAAYVHHNIITFEKQYETLLGERGVNLSGGQKQRVSIARALLNQPEILILDDCLSAVDTNTEEIILTNLLGMLKGKQNIFISHRVSNVQFADLIIVLDNGNIIEKGTHESLIKEGGVYFQMYQLQQLEGKKKV